VLRYRIHNPPQDAVLSHFFSWRWGGSSTQAWIPTYVSILRIPQMIFVWRATVKWYIDRGKPKNSEKNMSQCHFVHHKSHMDWLGARTRASSVRGRRLTTWAMEWPPGPY
jgi:hypothetical protein